MAVADPKGTALADAVRIRDPTPREPASAMIDA